MTDSPKTIPTWEEIKNSPIVQETKENWNKLLESLKASPQPVPKKENEKLTAEEQTDYDRLLEIAKTRKEEDKNLVFATARILGGGTGAITAGILPVIGSLVGGGAGAALASSAAKDFMDKDYEKIEFYEKYTRKHLYEKGDLPEKEHYELLKKSEGNRRLEDEELGNNIGKKIGGWVGEKENLSTQAVQAAYGQAGEVTVSFLRKHRETMPILVEHVKELQKEAGAAFDEAGRNYPEIQRNTNNAIENFIIETLPEWQCKTNEFFKIGTPCPPKQQGRR